MIPMPCRSALRFALLGLVLYTPGPATAQEAASATASIEIVNRTRWAIYEIYFSPSDADEWGDDQLDGETIEPGDHFTLSDIPCELWDVLLIDEEGDECVVLGVDLCRDDYKWVIENNALLACQGQSSD
jgi:hypothetical protein